MRSKIDAVIRGFYLFLASSWISLAITAVYVVILVNMEQGSIVVIGLFNSPANLTLFLLLVHLLAVLVSLYPVYITQWLAPRTERKRFRWLMHYEFLSSLGINTGLGLIEYRRKDDQLDSLSKEEMQELNSEEIERVMFTDKTYSVLRKLLGVVFYLGVIYTFYIIFSLFFQQVRIVSFWVFVIIILFTYFKVHSLNKEKNIHRASQWLLGLFVLGLLLFIATIILSATLGWSNATFYCCFMHIVVGLFWFIIFRRFRTHLLDPDAVWMPFSALANNKFYLGLVSIGGWLSLTIFLYAQFAAQHVNAAVIILSLFYVFYGLIIIPVKHFLLYEQETTFGDERRFSRYLFLNIFPVLPWALLLLSIVMARVGNDLHTLPELSQKDFITEEEFINGFHEKFETGDTIYFISSYGGGLRANVWTQKILSKLSHYPVNGDTVNILDQTVAMSGVSGGGLGFSFFQAMNTEHAPDPVKKDSIINEIAHSNYLSLDVAWTTGYDLFRELLPWIPPTSKDRSKKSMHNYQRILTDSDEMAELTFQEYFAKQFQQTDFQPALLLNATSYNNKRGVACSVSLDRFEAAFPDAINLSEIPPSSGLSYLYTTSITNRFPVFSPGAKIRKKGIFLDGGYFENSGGLSLYDFYSYLNNKTNENGTGLFDDYHVVFIQINNGKRSYAREVLSTYDELPIPQVKETGEISAVFNTITSTSSISVYTQKEISANEANESFDYVPVYLPYEIDEKFTKEVLYTKQLPDFVKSQLHLHNNQIDSLFAERGYKQWQIIEPALGRLLCDEAIDYMDIMIEEVHIFEDLNNVLNQ